MTVFVEIVTAGSLVAAAERLNLSPSMVGKHLNALEERLGVILQPFGLVKTDMMTGRLNRLLAGYATRGRDFICSTHAILTHPRNCAYSSNLRLTTSPQRTWVKRPKRFLPPRRRPLRQRPTHCSRPRPRRKTSSAGWFRESAHAMPPRQARPQCGHATAEAHNRA